MAMRELAKASELDPDNPEIDMTLGLAYQARGDLSKAEEHLRRAIDKKPDYADARNNLGIVLAERKEWDKAIREFEAAAENVMYTTPERAYFNLGEAYRAKGDPAGAESGVPAGAAGERSVRTGLYRALRGPRRTGEVERRGVRPHPVRGDPSRLRTGLDGAGARLAPPLAAGGCVEGVRQGPRGVERSRGKETGGRLRDAPRNRETMTPGHAGSPWKERRESMGKTIDQVSADLRIGRRFLAGIEEGNFGGFPGARVLRRLHPLVRQISLAGSGARSRRVRAEDRNP